MRRYSQGFTLIELLVVVALIGILSAIGVVSYGKYKTSAEKKQAEISLSSIYLAEQEYKSNNGSYYYNSSLNNIINEKEVIPELLQSECNAKEIFKSTVYFLKNPKFAQNQVEECSKTLDRIRPKSSSSDEAAKVLNKYLIS